MKKIILTIFTFSLLASLCEGQRQYFHFDSLASGMTSPGARVLALAMRDSIHDDPLFAGGHFTIAGRDTAINIAEWKVFSDYPYTGAWSPLGKGVDSDVCALAMYNNYLYAGGKFDSAAGIAANHIARWDTTAHKWDSLLGRLNGNVYALCVYKNNLYVGGDFTITDGDTVNRIAMWNGAAWAKVGKGFDTGAVYALTVSNDTLYAGGSFRKSNGVIVNHIAKSAGAAWSPLDSGTNNTVYALTDIRQLGGLFVGGAFTKAGSVTANYIGLYNDYSGWQWSTRLNPGMNDTVKALSSMFLPAPEIIGRGKAPEWFGAFGYFLIAGGVFDSVAGNPNSYLAAWSQFGIWDSAGAVLNGPVFALCSNLSPYYFGDVCLGGNFNRGTNYYPPPHTITINNIAHFKFDCTNCPGGVQNISDNSNIAVYPNPSNGNFNIVENGELKIENGKQRIEVYNVLGEQVYSQFSTLTPQLSINLSSQPNGIYLYRVIGEDGSLVGEGKLIIQK